MFVFCQRVEGQQLIDNKDANLNEPNPVRADSLENDSTDADTLYIPEHSPQKAALYSAIFPGLGQLYNKKYWKLPIIYVGLGVLAYITIENSNSYTNWHKAYIAYENGDATSEKKYLTKDKLGVDMSLYSTSSWSAILKSGNDFYRRWRDLDYIIAGGAYLLIMVDAIVDAHFYEFNVNDDLTLRVNPVRLNTANSKSFGINLNFSFNSNKIFKKKNKFVSYSFK
jgi:hypothetical protein